MHASVNLCTELCLLDRVGPQDIERKTGERMKRESLPGPVPTSYQGAGSQDQSAKTLWIATAGAM